MEDTLLDEHAIITPPTTNPKDIPVRRYKYTIDSRDRNTNIYKNPAKYTLKLDEAITDVTKVELLLTDFKFNNYNIHKYNNILHTSIADYEISSGVYDGPTLATELESATPFNVSFNELTKKFSFTYGTTVTLNFKSSEQRRYDMDTSVDTYPLNSIGKVIGFDIDEYILDPATPLTPPYPVDLETENYIVMFMQQAKVYQSKNNNIHNCFAIINKLESTSDGIVMIDNAISKTFNPPIASLSNLVFKFCDREGNLYDFQNKDHRFELVFTSLKQTRCYNEIFK
uniref:DUF5901 domain-containing protein n=1 Tax=Pyramimonas orientalis virus TaxID=455367 RepID=A0A7M3UNX0_POV01|nr:hypothetical protein HWQ62_00277 [Pyramimonas orientalis virus]